MRTNLFFLALALFMPPGAGADTIALKDGTRLEGVIEGELDGVALVKTQYGALNINRKDIVSVTKPEPPAAPAEPAAAEPPAESTGTAEPPPLPDLPPAAPSYTFKTVTLSTSAFEKIYYENETPLATELYDSRGELMGVRGAIKDATYKEFYENGNIKTEKTMLNSKLSGMLRAYYPDGTPQSEASYLDGQLNGGVRVYGATGKPLLEQNFRAGVPNGYFREFDAAGGLKSELFYVDGHIAEKPPAAEVKPRAETTETPDSGVTASSRRLARGERITFHLNGKYVAKLNLDKDLNIIAREGKLPDGAVRIYDKAGAVDKELVFGKNELVLLKTYAAGGVLSAEYYYVDGKAVKK